MVDNPQEQFANTTLIDQITKKTEPNEFMGMVKGIMTDEDRKMFKDDPQESIAQAILYPSVFAPYPATFDSEAFAVMLDGVLEDYGHGIDPDKVARLLTISLENGIVEMQEDGRLYVPEKIVNKVKPLLEKF